MTQKTVLVTGCSSGFGHLLVHRMLKRGWHVVATMRRANERRDLITSTESGSAGNLTVLELDVTRSEDLAKAAAFVQGKCQGSLDALVNNAGYGLFGALEELTEGQLRDQMEVNFFGVALLTRALLPYLRASRGRVVNISSVFGYTGMPLTAAYCASKFALEGLSEALYHELRPHGVQVAVVQPGGHRTRFGQNSRWSNDRCSTYGVQRANYQNLQSKLMTRKAVSADHVAAIAEKLLLCPVMPLRVRAGRDAAVAHWLRRLLPEFLSLAVTSRVYDRIFTNPVAVPSLPSSLEIQP